MSRKRAAKSVAINEVSPEVGTAAPEPPAEPRTETQQAVRDMLDAAATSSGHPAPPPPIKVERANIGLPSEQHRTVNAACKLLGVSLSEAVSEALGPWLVAKRDEIRKRSSALMSVVGE
jgi:hypothetical protein